MARPNLTGLSDKGLTLGELMPFLHGIRQNHEEMIAVGVIATRFVKGEATLDALAQELVRAGFLPKGFTHERQI